MPILIAEKERLESRSNWTLKMSWLPPARSPLQNLVDLATAMMDALYGAISANVMAFSKKLPFSTGQQSTSLPSFTIF